MVNKNKIENIYREQKYTTKIKPNIKRKNYSFACLRK